MLHNHVEAFKKQRKFADACMTRQYVLRTQFSVVTSGSLGSSGTSKLVRGNNVGYILVMYSWQDHSFAFEWFQFLSLLVILIILCISCYN